MKKNHNGFGAIEALLVLIIVGMIGFVGWYVYHTKSSTDKTLNTAVATSAAAKTPSSTKAKGSPVPASNPSANDIALAHSAMLAYCNANKAAGDSCSLDATADKTAPGFVLTNGGATTANGAADSLGTFLAKDIEGTWTVIWFGQSCVPQATGVQYSIPSTMNVCVS